MRIFRFLFFSAFLTLFSSNLSCKEITLEFLNSKPRSITKDFYIWKFLDQDISPLDAKIALTQVNKLNYKLFYKFEKKMNDPEWTHIAKCIKSKPKDLTNKDPDCIELGLSPYKATLLHRKDLLDISQKIEEKYPKKAKVLKTIASKNIFEKIIKSKDNDIFFEIYNRCGKKYRKSILDCELPKKFLDKLSSDWRFNFTIKLIVTDNKIKNIKKSLLTIKSDKLNSQSNFFLALNALNHGEKEKALKYLKISEEKAYYRFDKDKILFWEFLITNNREILYKLTESFDINIYTLFALEKLGNKPKNIIENIECAKDIPIKDYDHFKWVNTLEKLENLNEEEILELSSSFDGCSRLPHKAYLLERANYYHKHYFVMPYFKHLKKYEKERIALILAIGRQESRFIPTSVSTSYALGMMQFMPFLAKDIAKTKKYKNFDLEDMFKPETAYRFADIHLDYLEKYLYHPLFIAYAYNGGIGFTKRLLQSGVFKKGKYEPFMSMELVHYDESRKYGKKVLANYIIYSALLGKEEKITHLLKILTEPSHTDRFRK